MRCGFFDEGWVCGVFWHDACQKILMRCEDFVFVVTVVFCVGRLGFENQLKFLVKHKIIITAGSFIFKYLNRIPH